MPKVKGVCTFNYPWYLRKKVFTQVFTFGGIYLFTDRVITHFGSNFLKISRDFAYLGVGRT